ncbi:hypothetical protein ATE68_01370 [Sphingopyxis sp. H038]|uniref:Swt1 family HEPN domain-containing protein n=1 Tax=unclassified Sphingopyxis TaxID=2614943 RepID=UPI00073047A2|nr:MULTISPECIES: Swt1 family HEPN domain-containing protein [unclassified Sphingopyxis]KTE04328.1 hypothetical protein ATE78_01370 [Sphingopyxis sp. H012]KTE10831.1 hypothetical protein ATE76_12970 [Sphingopyxis sp. H093]KTE13470.1 hypothetical protein ATE70_02055 [Sphingopyxis sp. H053]KTE25668.1 hypothetical protein ATE75_16320 [Sphingopyxis sp. H080]KTE36818.1 hypothetical protein ATE68_01370 [Sphingopyxis sp. H038]
MDDPLKSIRHLMESPITRAMREAGLEGSRLGALSEVAKLRNHDFDAITGAFMGRSVAAEALLPKSTILDDLARGRSPLDEAMERALQLHDPYSSYGQATQEILKSLIIGKAHDAPFARAMVVATKMEEALQKELLPSSRIFAITQRLGDPTGLAALQASDRAALGISAAGQGAFERARHWSDGLTHFKGADLSALIGGGDRIGKEIDAIRLAAGGLASASHMLAGADDRHAGIRAMLEPIGAKFSIFGGAMDVLGSASMGSRAAFDAIFGGYSAFHAPTDRGFWADPHERAHYYRDQDVDEGLIDADAAETVAMLVESGVTEGARTRQGTITAVIEVGPIRLRIAASRPRAGAYAAIDAFEARLRAFVTAMLEPLAGPKWFVQRVPGDIVRKAKERRQEAMRAGEASMPLIHYTDIGDLLAIILRRDNWEQMFEAITDHRDWLRTDLERLNALRRPTMHGRPIDSVQLGEAVLTIRRLTGWMERDADWLSGWDDDA